jgi:hypothetical protein
VREWQGAQQFQRALSSAAVESVCEYFRTEVFFSLFEAVGVELESEREWSWEEGLGVEEEHGLVWVERALEEEARVVSGEVAL